MRKNKLLLGVFSLLVLLLVSCSPEADPVIDPNEDTEEVEETNDLVEEEIMAEFDILAQDSPAPDVFIQFIDENIGNISPKNADVMIDTLITSLKSNKMTYEDRIFELDIENELIAIDGLESTFQEASIDKIQNEELKKQVKYLYSNMYKLINVEGGFYPVVDYSKLKKYDTFVGEELKSYIEIKRLESDTRSMSDGGLRISFKELAERIYQAEDYLKIASPGDRKEDILEDYGYKISAYLKGLPNTPIMDYETKKINEEVLESYRETARKEYEISVVVNEYLEIIEGNENIIDDEILKKADELIDTLKFN